jgi:fatty acid elongase 3
VFVYFASYTYFTSTYFTWMPNSGTCAGEEFAAISGLVILTSYLFLFIAFYIATYKKPASTRKGRGRAKSALIEMKDEKVPTASQVTRRFSGGKATIPNFAGDNATPQKSPAAESSGSASGSGRKNGYATRSRKA